MLAHTHVYQEHIEYVQTLASESVLAGSAGIDTSTLRVSTAITPTGIPPKLEAKTIT